MQSHKSGHKKKIKSDIHQIKLLNSPDINVSYITKTEETL